MREGVICAGAGVGGVGGRGLPLAGPNVFKVLCQLLLTDREQEGQARVLSTVLPWRRQQALSGTLASSAS